VLQGDSGMAKPKAKNREYHSIPDMELLKILLDTGRDHSSEPGKNQTFNEYMLNTLQRSHEFMIRVGERDQQAINFFMILFTALAGGAIAIVTNVQNEFLKLLFLSLDLATIAGFGILTYIWIIQSVFERTQEGFFQFFLHKYFRDIDPVSFQKYGLSELVFYYRTPYTIKISQTSFNAHSANLLLLTIFSSVLLSISSYISLILFVGETEIIIPTIIGISCASAMTIMRVILYKIVSKNQDKGRAILLKYHKS
jgi:hypothetical protein